jgi:hypothetical protein
VGQKFLAQEITIIAFVSKQQPRFTDRYCQQIRNSILIRGLATGQGKAERTSQTVCASVDFRRKAAT